MTRWHSLLAGALLMMGCATSGRAHGEAIALSPAARCYEFEVANRDGPDWRWLVLDTVTVERKKHANEQHARRLALRLGAPAPYEPSRTAWVTTADSIEVLTLIAVPGYTLAETREGLAGNAWLHHDFATTGPDGKVHWEVTRWPTRLRRIPCTGLPAAALRS